MPHWIVPLALALAAWVVVVFLGGFVAGHVLAFGSRLLTGLRHGVDEAGAEPAAPIISTWGPTPTPRHRSGTSRPSTHV